MTRSTCIATFRLRPARSGLVVALFFAAAGAAWGADGANAAQPVKARIDASKTRAPISQYVYGQFIEHIAGIINNGLWAEMLDDRKFLQPIAAPPSPAPPARGRFAALRRWSPVGPADSITMDSDRPYVGDHSPLVKLNGAEQRGIRQTGLAVRRGRSYSGRIVLAGTPGARVTVSLVWAEGAEARQASVVGTLSATCQTFPLRFTALADSDDARLEITGTGQGAFHVGAVSLMPADNIEGFRPEVIAALKQLRSGVYRFPGGNFVSAHEWRDAIGERDRRPPVLDPVWNAVQPNDVGTDEFMTLCRLLEVEPYITVNAGFGDAWSAAQYVEYTNGAVTTPMGRLRAANGHPEPYGVRFWGIGNEAWGDWQFGAMSLAQFVVKHNLFAKAMKRVDPTIQLVASGAMPDAMTGSKQSQRIGGKVIPDPLSAADWTGGLLLHCLENTDLISEHFYSYANRRFDLTKGDSVPLDAGEPLIDWMRRPANHVRAKYEAYEDYLARIPALKAKPVPINLDEWAYSGVPPNSYKVVPAYAWTFHEMFRHSDLYQMAGFTFATSLLSADRSSAVLNPAGLLFQLYRDRFGTIPVEVTGNSPQPPPKYPAGGEEPRVNAGSDTFPLDVVAAWTADHRTLTIAVINPTESVQRLELAIAGAELADTGRLWRMAPADLNATVVVGQKPGVAVEEQALDAVPSAPSFAPFSVNVYAFPVASPATQYPFQNPDLPMEERITDLIGRMTLDEKIDALATRASVARLGVDGSPHIEGYHGVAQGGPSNWGRRNPTATTQFPQAYGLGSTWDPELVRRVAAQEAQEARYLYQSRKYQRAGLIVRAPNADLARDPRWGRTEEVYGEDPFHAGTLATAFTRGLQGDDPRYWKTAALLKHFLANSNEDDRERSSSNFDERLWREYYAKPFEMAVRQGGARAMMAAYNAVNGTPAHVHPMLKDIVVREWGLDGILCTDGGGLRLLVSDHKAFADLPAAAAACMKAGINHFLDRQKEPVTEAVQKGLLSEAQIDEALRGLFRVSIRLGLLDPAERVPYAKIGADGDPEPWSQPATHSLVREVTRKSIVLLKNSANLLPLDRAKVKSIAVVGPLANTVLLDWYSGTPPYAVSPREGIERGANPGPPRPGGGPGVTWVGDMSQAAIDTARSREVAVVCVGTHPESNAGWNIVTSPSEGKEGVDRKEITLPHGQEEFVRRVVAANPNTVVVLIASYPVALPWAARNATTILHMTHASQELGNALADVLFGDANPSGRLAQTWPASVEQLPPMMDYDLRHGRTYMYSQAEPQYAFGFGLSYTRFSYGNLRTSTEDLRGGGTLDVSVDVTNAGQRAGDEVVQLYVRYPGSNVERPRKQLRGFARVALAPGETKTVTLGLAAADLAYWDAARHAWVVEPGRVELMVGPSSADADLKLRRTVSVGPSR